QPRREGWIWLSSHNGAIRRSIARRMMANAATAVLIRAAVCSLCARGADRLVTGGGRGATIATASGWIVVVEPSSRFAAAVAAVVVGPIREARRSTARRMTAGATGAA